MVCLLGNRKKRVSRNWIRGINFSLIEGEQPNFYAENIPFSCNSLSNPSPKFVSRRLDFFQTPISRAFRQDFKSSYQNATSGSIVQCSNLHVRQRVGSCDVKHDSRSGGCEFDLPNRPFLCPWSYFTRLTYSCTLWVAACVISLVTITNFRGAYYSATLLCQRCSWMAWSKVDLSYSITRCNRRNMWQLAGSRG